MASAGARAYNRARGGPTAGSRAESGVRGAKPPHPSPPEAQSFSVLGIQSPFRLFVDFDVRVDEPCHILHSTLTYKRISPRKVIIYAPWFSFQILAIYPGINHLLTSLTYLFVAKKWGGLSLYLSHPTFESGTARVVPRGSFRRQWGLIWVDAFKIDCKRPRTVAVIPIRVALQKSSVDISHAWTISVSIAIAVIDRRIARSRRRWKKHEWDSMVKCCLNVSSLSLMMPRSLTVFTLPTDGEIYQQVVPDQGQVLVLS